MIKVEPQPEPRTFNELVRVPGRQFIARVPNPTTKEWAENSYWRRVLTEFRRLYRGICAYSCHWIPPDTGGKTVEHFVAKHEDPSLAYEWHNYRLVCAILNSRKRTGSDVLDPFLVENGWFVIDFPSLLVKPNPNLDQDVARKVRDTIRVLRLNDEDTCLENRARFVEDYCRREVTFAHLQRNAPFLAMELERQRLVERIRDIMLYD